MENIIVIFLSSFELRIFLRNTVLNHNCIESKLRSYRVLLVLLWPLITKKTGFLLVCGWSLCLTCMQEELAQAAIQLGVEGGQLGFVLFASSNAN